MNNIYIHVYVYIIYIYIYIYIYMFICIYIYVYTYICMYVYMYIYVYIYLYSPATTPASDRPWKSCFTEQRGRVAFHRRRIAVPRKRGRFASLRQKVWPGLDKSVVIYTGFGFRELKRRACFRQHLEPRDHLQIGKAALQSRTVAFQSGSMVLHFKEGELLK